MALLLISIYHHPNFWVYAPIKDAPSHKTWDNVSQAGTSHVVTLIQLDPSLPYKHTSSETSLRCLTLTILEYLQLIKVKC